MKVVYNETFRANSSKTRLSSAFLVDFFYTNNIDSKQQDFREKVCLDRNWALYFYYISW